MPAGQADAYALLLDTLGIDRAAVFGYSGGGPSAIQFALRHAGRTTALILMASALPGKAGAPPKTLAQAIFGSDRLFWMLKSYAPALFARILGMPKGFHPTPEERGRIGQTMDSLFPIHPRKRGVQFDLYVSNPDVQAYPLEELSVPTLIINVKDDGLSAFGNAAQAARRIRRSKLVAIDRGGHLLLGSETRIQEEIAAFEKSMRSGGWRTVRARLAAEDGGPADRRGQQPGQRAVVALFEQAGPGAGRPRGLHGPARGLLPSHEPAGAGPTPSDSSAITGCGAWSAPQLPLALTSRSSV
jgi:hypothetical protein